MAETGARRLRASLGMIKEITSFYMVQEINEHGSCMLEGTVAEEYKDNSIQENTGNTIVELSVTEEPEGTKTILFTGVIGELSVYQEGEVWTFKAKLYTCTLLMDLEKKSRSFQDVEMTYLDLIKKIVSEYDGGDILDLLTEGRKLGELVIQYEETDWEFLKRLASHFNGSLLPEETAGTPKVFFGAAWDTQPVPFDQPFYTLEKRPYHHKMLLNNGFKDYLETDAALFTVEERDYHEAGTAVTYRGISLYIERMEGILRKGELVFRYDLCTKKGLGQLRIGAKRLAGVSLPAKVLEAVGDKVKVRLEIDGQQPVDRAWEFPYQTMYTGGSGGGWYCMPEKGDPVMIYFPGDREADAMGTCSFGKEGEGKTGSPEIKYFRTIHGKEIRFTPEAVEIICSDGKGHENARITLHQDDGITINSQDGITFESGKDIRLKAGEEIELSASRRIRLHCRKGRILMDGKIDISGPDVRIN